MVIREGSRLASAEQRLQELGIKLPEPHEPFGTYVEAVQTGNLLFLSGMLPTEGHGAKFIGRVGAELQGWAAGTPADSEDTLRFAELTGVRPMIETYPLENADEAYARMMSGKAQFRVVLTM